MLNKKILYKKYILEEKSISQISKELSCSNSKVIYWMDKFDISRRNISEAIYKKHNPKGDPFKFYKPKTKDDLFLYGLGLGLFMGEGNKKTSYGIRLGNSDLKIILFFIKFLEKFFNIKKSQLKFGIQIFSDTSIFKVKKYWKDNLKIQDNQFYKVTVSNKIRKTGTYKHKSEYGVITIYFNNTKSKKVLDDIINKL